MELPGLSHLWGIIELTTHCSINMLDIVPAQQICNMQCAAVIIHLYKDMVLSSLQIVKITLILDLHSL